MTGPTVDSHSEIPALANRLTPEALAAIEAAGEPNPTLERLVQRAVYWSDDYRWDDCYAQVLKVLGDNFTRHRANP